MKEKILGESITLKTCYLTLFLGVMIAFAQNAVSAPNEPIFVKFSDEDRNTSQFKDNYNYLKRATKELGGKVMKTMVGKEGVYLMLDFKSAATPEDVNLALEIIADAYFVEKTFPTSAFTLEIKHLNHLVSNPGEGIPDRKLHGLRDKKIDYQPDLNFVHVPGEVIVKYLKELPGDSSSSTKAESVKSLKAKSGTKIKKSHRRHGGELEVLEFDPDDVSMENVILELNKDPFVEYAEPNGCINRDRLIIKNGP